MKRNYNYIKKLIAMLLVLSAMFTMMPMGQAASEAKGKATSNVIIRKSTSTSSGALATIKKGDSVTVLSVDGDWAKVKDGSVTGYVAARYLQISGKVEPQKTESITVLRKGDRNDEVKAMQKKLIAQGFLDTDATGFFGSATEIAVKNFQKSVGISADGVAGRITLEALTDSGKKESRAMQKGDEDAEVTRLQKMLIQLGFLQTEATGYFGSATESAVKAFQKAESLSADGVAGAKTMEALEKKTAPEKVLSNGVLREGDENDEVKAMQKLLIAAGYLKTEATGFFGTATAAAVRSFQKENGLTADGEVGKKTIEKLNEVLKKQTEKKSENKADHEEKTADQTVEEIVPEEKTEPTVEKTRVKGNVELVDWWSGTIDKLIRRGATFTVTDVKTGKSFTAARYGGSNHMDAEPYKPSDTAAMYEIFNKTWTWSARAVWITYDGVTYAAAMNGMPHGGERINDNNFDGQFCIHFLNSRTHGGNQVNQDMQKRIQEAFEAA